MASLWTWGIDYQNQPLLDAWWTPGWTSQNRDTASVQVPPNNFLAAGFPSGLTYATVTGNFFDTTSDPLSGYFTFWPSDMLIFNVGGQLTYMPQRYAGVNQTLLGINQMGDGKIYLQYGQLSVNLLATDNANMTPTTFTYHVKEYFKGGCQYDIEVPSADSSTPTDIHNLIIPGSIRSLNDDNCRKDDRVKISSVSTQYLVANVSDVLPPGITQPNLSNYPVSFAFIPGKGIPTTSTTFYTGGWATTSSPFYSQILIGSGSGGQALSIGSYRVWIQIQAAPQVPVFSAGYLDIY